MPLNIPAPQGSIRPFFTAVRDYLLKDIDDRTRTTENPMQLNHLNRIRAFAETIDPNTITIQALLRDLSQAGERDLEDTSTYITQINEGLERYFTRTDLWNNNALIIAATNHPEAVQPLLDAMPAALKRTVFEQVSLSGMNALMMAAYKHPEVVQLLLDAMPEASKQTVFEQVNATGNNALTFAAYNHPGVVQLLLDAMPDTSKKRVFEQTNQFGKNALMIAADHHPMVVQLLLDAMSTASKQLTFQYEDERWYRFGSKIIQSLFATNQVNSVLTLLQEGVLTVNGRAFKEIVAHKQQLFNYIMNMKESLRTQFLEDIHNNTQNSQLAKVFHTSRWIFAPQRDRNILGQAENEYLKLNDIANDDDYHEAPFYEITPSTPAYSYAPNQASSSSSSQAEIPVSDARRLEAMPNIPTMSLEIKSVQGSIRPFFTAVRDYLLKNIDDRTRTTENPMQLNHLNRVRAFAETIDPDSITIEALLRDLSQAGEHDFEDTRSYIALVSEGLDRYLIQTDDNGCNALILAAANQPEEVQPLLDAMPETLKTKVFEQRNRSGGNALMFAAAYHPQAVQPLLDSMSASSKQIVFEQVDQHGQNALMSAAYNHPEAVKPLLDAMPAASKRTVFEQVNRYRHNALMMAAHNHPEAVQSLLDAIPDTSKKRVFGQTDQFGENALMIAAARHPKVVQLLLDAMSTASKQLTFQREDMRWFRFGSEIIQSLFATNQVNSVLTLLQEGVLSVNGRAFKEIVAHKQQLFNYIMNMKGSLRTQLLKDIHDNMQNSQLAKVFHTSRRIFAPQRDRGILEQAVNEYLRLNDIASNAVKNSKSFEKLHDSPSLPLDVSNAWNELSGRAMRPTFAARLRKIGFEGEIPRRFKCPITLHLMNEPVLFSDGHHYDEDAIRVHIGLNRESLKSPITNLRVEARYTADNDLISDIDEFVLKQERNYKIKACAPSLDAFNEQVSPVASSSQYSTDNHATSSLYPCLAQPFGYDYRGAPFYEITSSTPVYSYAPNQASSSTSSISVNEQERAYQLEALPATSMTNHERESHSNPVFYNKPSLTSMLFFAQNTADSFASTPVEIPVSDARLLEMMPNVPTTSLEIKSVHGGNSGQVQQEASDEESLLMLI